MKENPMTAQKKIYHLKAKGELKCELDILLNLNHPKINGLKEPYFEKSTIWGNSLQCIHR